MDAPTNVTQLLVSWSSGDQAALDALTPLIHQELHRIAARYMAGERPGHLLQADRAGQRSLPAAGRLEGCALAEPRPLLRGGGADHAARAGRHGADRGIAPSAASGQLHVSLSEAAGVAGRRRTIDLVALDDALKTLETLSPRQSRVVELRFFGGLSLEETAHVLDVSVGTVQA